MSSDKTSQKAGVPAPSYRGKVRDVYDLGDKLLLVSSDRLSAFDVVFGDTIPGKGKILNTISAHWFSLLSNIPNHFISAKVDAFPEPFNTAEFAGRTALVRKSRRIDFECVVRAYLMGSGFKEYSASQTLAGEPLPAGLSKGARLPHPVFTPAVKNDVGHDENISFAEMKRRLSRAESRGLPDLADELKEKSLAIFRFAYDLLAKRDILLLDTKFEFGIIDGNIVLIDEIFTPDSSRFVERSEYGRAIAEQREIPTMDKQIIRDYVESIGWDKNPPAPKLPQEVIDKTVAQYKKMEEIVLSLRNGDPQTGRTPQPSLPKGEGKKESQ